MTAGKVQWKLDNSLASAEPQFQPDNFGRSLNLCTRVAIGDAALTLMNEPSYTREWLDLYLRCPWATEGQDPRFIQVRSNIYQSVWQPVLIEQRQSGRLVGLLAMARQTKGNLVGGGAEDCEYNTWISDQDHAESFMPDALDTLWLETSLPHIRLSYLTPDTPLQWLSTPPWRDRHNLVSCQRRVHKLDSVEEIEKFVRSKKSLRALKNQITRLNTLRIRRIENEEFPHILESFIAMNDARKSIKCGSALFQRDLLKRELLIARMAIPGLQHVTVLELGDRPIAAHIGLTGRPGGVFSLAGITHDPAWDKYSPGSLLLGELLPLLCREGYSSFDLTPGDDVYKNRWGTAVENVFSLEIFPTKIDRYATKTRKLISRSCARISKIISGRNLGRR